MAVCPNKSHPDWKALVSKYGEHEAMKMFIANDNNIPNPDGARKSKRGKSVIESATDFIGQHFKSANTLDHIDKHPETFSKMLDELKSNFPLLNIKKDFIIDEQGNKVEIPAGKVGMHYRSAVMSAIAYSNDSYMETVPHEYAHEYIDMYRNHPIVSDAIKKYGEERLVTLIGRKYAGNKMSGTFETFLKNFWKLIRKTFGFPSVVDILTDSFAKNEILGEPMARGTEIYNYQDIEKPMGRVSLESFSKETEGAKAPIKDIKEGSEEIRKIFEEKGFFDSDLGMVDGITSFWTELSSKIKIESKNNYKETDIKYLELVSKDLEKNDGLKYEITSKIKDNNFELDDYAYDIYKYIIKTHLNYEYRKLANSSYISDNGNFTNKETVNKILNDELQDTFDNREKVWGSKNKYVKKIAKEINKVLTYVTNTRLWAKYLSGSENSLFSLATYKLLNQGEKDAAEFRFGFLNLFKTKDSSFQNSSIFYNPKADISELDTTDFQLKRYKKGSEVAESTDTVPLTKSELLNIYLMLRQPDASKTISEKGFHLRTIKGRDTKIDKVYKLTNNQKAEINRIIEGDTEAMGVVADIDAAMEYSYNKLNSKFRIMEGYDMETIDNYFPIYHGTQNLDITKSKNVIADMRQLRARMGGGDAIRIEDTFQVLASMRQANASYYGFAIPIHNANQAISSIEKEYNNKDEAKYIQAIKGTINKVQDSGALYSTQGETAFSKRMNKLTGNFAVALLAKNLGVVMKQQVSLVTAQEVINNKYLRQAGESLGPFNFVNPFKLLKALSWTGIKDGETMMPLEWKQFKDSPIYQELIKYPWLRERFEGAISREGGEALMGRDISDDKIKIPFIKQDGKSVYITKSRLMQSITLMDTLTIMRIYSAVKLETQDRMNDPKFKNLSEKQIEEHNISRLSEIIEKTQPTFDQTNRTGLSQSANPLARTFTMFTSATQKVSMLLLEGTIDYINNPTIENRNKIAKRTLNTALTMSIMLTTIDMMRYALLNGWDDDDTDELFERYALGSIKGSLGSIQGVGPALGIVISQLDSNPWYQTVQHPVEHIMQEGMEGVANVSKGNFGRAFKQLFGAVAKTQGYPITLQNNVTKLFERVTE